MTRCGDVATSARGEPTSVRGKGGDNASWFDANLTEPKNRKKLTRSI
jgi:hypothetical protein